MSKICVLSISIGISFISIFAILSAIFIPIIDPAKNNSDVDKRLYNTGGPTPFLPMEKCVLSHFFPWGKMGKKYTEREGNEYFSLSFHILFSPWGKMGKHTFSMGKNGVGPPNTKLKKDFLKELMNYKSNTYKTLTEDEKILLYDKLSNKLSIINTF